VSFELGSRPSGRPSYPDGARRSVPSLTPSELRALFEGVNGTRDSIRDRAILLVLLDTGLRLGELVRLSVGDVDLIEGRCRVMGKGAKERVVPIGGRTRRALRAWIVTRRRVVDPDPLFISRRGGRLTPRAFQQLVHRLAVAAGVSTRCWPPILRHSFARAFLANGGDVFSLQHRRFR
jgi:integrase/recombinase XerC